MVTLVALAVLVAAPPTPSSVVLLSRRTSVSIAEASALTSRVAGALAANGVTVSTPPDAAAAALKRLGFPDSSSCGGKRECLVELGRQLQVEWVFAVSVTKVENDRSVGVELIHVTDGSSPEKDAVVLAPKADLTPDLLAAFAKRVLDRWSPRPSDTPAAVTVTPPATPRPPPPDLPPPPPPPAPEAPRSHLASWVLGGLGAAALVASGVFLASGLARWGSIYEPGVDAMNRRVSLLTFAEASARRDLANTDFTISGVLGGTALALGLAAVLTW
ncbi:MAG: hypothetical protein MUC96_21640 [Myxococcaceae bacterium]|jgi:hypothetical protein|nr:hypothetical protein [Myxococcaceae bacterium]